MQRKPTKTTRGPSACEKRFHSWVKEHECIVTGAPGPSILHHCEGATFKHNKTLIGHWFVLPLCKEVDDVVTLGSRKAFREKFGPQSRLWLKLIREYPLFREIPISVYTAIRECGR